jgi:hypothetical protein
MKHGTTTRYRDGCRCEKCRSAKVVANRNYGADRTAKQTKSEHRGQLLVQFHNAMVELVDNKERLQRSIERLNELTGKLVKLHR